MPRQRVIPRVPGLVFGKSGPGADAEKLWPGTHENGIPKTPARPGVPLVAGHRSGQKRIGCDVTRAEWYSLAGEFRRVPRWLTAGTRRRGFGPSTSGLPDVPAAASDGPYSVENVGKDHPHFLPNGDRPAQVLNWRERLMAVVAHDPMIMTGRDPVAHTKSIFGRSKCP